MEVALILEKLILIVLVFAVTMLVALYSTYAERKVAGFLQDRYGPNRAGIFGLLQPICDGAKLFSKEEFMPNTPNKILFITAPAIAMSISLLGVALIPWAKEFVIDGYGVVKPYIGDVNIGILYIVAVLSTSVYGVVIGGWASNNKYSLMGSIRAGAQMISYEIAMGLSLIALVMMTGSLSLVEITEQQSGWHGMQWNVIYQPLTFIIFLVCSFAECNRTPFDLAECESELVNGHHTEYSSLGMGFFMFSEYASMFFSSAFISVLFFGGYNYPGIDWVAEKNVNLANGIGVLALMAKTLFFIFFYMWVRWTIPRFRYDQLMKLGWKMLFPLAIVNIFLVGIGVLIFK
ncbi:NADH-quinone oxidoreductase subunit NuoH [Dysgonomonas sp. Marseille-P4677]|uniref:NADH-quinone oxidoreductase subunit NuoH n=1 Tax=Dysgonomonas sp. Marseille-P4677 TaxID=2364790 RepID=UPI001912D44A|nr:NADH-quinone oxidoreductase subunit NuoH [Dysgonomonas sp. Marseille-P4677]MBK5719972.1 NADH-quinone oxidoreductase subunit NuoH [Dysgonomonas sp. Marseille-P4677]